ncbi:tRNA epoxyqueuosine(34) reductase QueG [Parathalassolituus penaei]|uniref:Epoxyqueuosine reductase n=1 Tax=Parathalassolituus penaei TaxID=2997323 RepID=A0A9X3EAU2_9GAMM|nr:tRNA epoxyqueuosine(34) reductase QueG [Parathalassolituus penaei]MCY0964187.1 tRNA epoxyqueuosine(34) reductase QueG [Parathalassolituus penaei]
MPALPDDHPAQQPPTPPATVNASPEQLQHLRRRLDELAREFGFQQVGVTGTDLSRHGEYLKAWLAEGYHGEMSFMAEHDDLRWHPERLHPGTIRVISLRMDYLPPEISLLDTLNDPDAAYISRYALGRDYHKMVRHRIARLGDALRAEAGQIGIRALIDSAPILERAAAEAAGLGWIGKNCMLINRSAGSWFFLGELLTDLPLPIDTPDAADHCGSCNRCIDICPTQAFVGARILDARRCISYLTIELVGPIPVELRAPMGNRIFGCDDCQLVCPWNRFASPTREDGFYPRNGLDNISLLELFLWDEATFMKKTEGMPIRRAGYENWQRNVAVGLGNAPASAAILEALQQRRNSASELVREHIDWAIARQTGSPDNI